MLKYLKYVFLLFLVFVFIGCGEKEEVNSYSVTFIVDEKVEVVKVGENEKVSKPSDPVKEGFIFAGWFIEDNLYDFNEEVTKDISLTARFDNVITKIEAETESYIFYLNEVNLTDISNKGYIYSGSEKEEVVINYDYSNVDTEKEGSYKVKGSIDIKDGYVLSSDILNEVYITVTIKPERALIKEILKRDDYSCYVGEKSTDVIPNRCRAVLENGEIVLVSCKWDFTTVNFNEVGEYVIEGVVTVPGEYKLDEGISLNTSMNITVKDYRFYIEEINDRSRDEYYVRDNICLEIKGDDFKINKIDGKENFVTWYINESDGVYCLFDFADAKETEAAVHVLKEGISFDIVAVITYEGVEYRSKEIHFDISYYDEKEKDKDSVVILCDEKDLKYLDPFSEGYVYCPNQFYVLLKSTSIKFMTYPEGVNTKEEKANYIIAEYNNKTALFDVVFMSSDMIELIMEKDSNVFWEIIYKKDYYGGTFQQQITSYKGKEYGRVYFPEHPLGMVDCGLFYSSSDLIKYDIEDPAGVSFEKWAEESVGKLPGGVSLIEENEEKFISNLSRMMVAEKVDGIYVDAKKIDINVIKEYYEELKQMGVFGENAILRYEQNNADSFIGMPYPSIDGYIMKPKKESMVFSYLNPRDKDETNRIYDSAAAIDSVLNRFRYQGVAEAAFNAAMRIESDFIYNIYAEEYGITNRNCVYYELRYDNGRCNSRFVYE